MKIILNKDVDNLGEEGDVKVVADGYARNFLLPKDLAVPFNKGTVAVFESKKNAIQKRKEEKVLAARSLKEKVEAVELSIVMPVGERGKLFGSVTNATVAEALSKKGFNIEKKKIELPDHTIKSLGSFTVKIKLYEQEVASVKLEVLGDTETAEVEKEVVEVESEEVVEETVEEEVTEEVAEEDTDSETKAED